MFSDYKDECQKIDEKVLSYTSYKRELTSLNISFAKLGIEDCEIYAEHKVYTEATTSSGIPSDYDDKKDVHDKKALGVV